MRGHRLKDSFEQLYRAHYARVRGLCRQLLGGHAGHAEDAAQEAFMRAYRAFDTYDGTQPFGAWIMRIASNHCIDLVRRRAKEARLFAPDEPRPAEPAADEPDALTRLVTSERAEGVRSAIAALPDNYRVPLVLAYYRGASYHEIADSLGVTRNHVGTLILRGKQRLRRALGTHEEED